MSEPLVSIIIPAYNAEATIGEALASALAQTYAALEVIIVDDGSGDRTAEIVEEVAARDRRVTLLRQQNRGVAAARNRAIEHARGEYIAPLDADDVWAPEKLAAQVQRMEQGGAAMGMVYSWWIGLDPDGTPTLATTPWDVEGDVYETLLYMNFIGNASVPLFRRSALEQVGLYDARLREQGGQGCEDWDLSLRVAERFHVGVAPGYHVGYRTVPGSMSFNCDTMAESYRLVVEAVRRQQPDIPPELFRWSRGNFFTYLANMSYAENNHWEALRWVVRAAWVDPAALLSSYTVRLGLKSLLRVVAQPLLGGRSVPRKDGARRAKDAPADLVEEAVRRGLPWTSWKPYDRVYGRRWRLIRNRDRRLMCLA